MELTEKTLYAPILEGEISGLEDFEPEDFRPAPGTILVVRPPPKTETKGGIQLPETSLIGSQVGKVAAVPWVPAEGPRALGKDPKCPVDPGQFIVFRGDGSPVNFGERKDLILIQYMDGPDSEILGWFDP